MVDKPSKKTSFGNHAELSTPRFDEHASAKAQPVMPIRKISVSRLLENVNQQFTNGVGSLALVVALGIVTGAVVGMALVKEPQFSLAGANEQVSVLADVESPQIQEWQVAVGVYGIQNSAARHRRSVVRRSRVPNDGQNRAYRFAVIR